MKRKLSTLLFLTALITCFGVMQAQALTIGFDVSDSYIEVGESFDVDVWALDDTIPDLGDLLAFGFDVDPFGALSLFTYDGYTVDPDYDDTGYNFDPLLSPSYVGGIYNGWGNAGSQVYLATLSFTAAVAGTDTLEIDGVFDGWDHGLYYALSDEDIVSSIGITVVPEPATILLVGTGLLGIIGFGRKRFNKKA